MHLHVRTHVKTLQKDAIVQPTDQVGFIVSSTVQFVSGRVVVTDASVQEHF